MNAKISAFVICVEAIVYLLLNNLHDCTFNYKLLGNENSSDKCCVKFQDFSHIFCKN